jgi:hypothetical protein
MLSFPYSITLILAPPSVPLVTNPRLQDSEYSVFNVLDLFQSCWYIYHKHLITNILSAIRDSDGQFTWVDFMPTFHTALIKWMCTLLPPGFTSFIVAHGKWVLFVFLQEILTGNKGPKPKVFWHACKKYSRAS